MNPERLQKIQDLFHAVLEHPPEGRATFLAECCGEDDSLRSSVESLLKHHQQAENFIESPATIVVTLIEEKGHSLVGKSIGRYKVLEMLGEGGMGEVLLAQDTTLGRRVALKILPALYTDDSDRLRRFEQEARTASALNHPNIITIYEVGHVDSTHFIATEYLEGATLRTHLATSKMTTSEALDIAVQVASALAAAHAKGIVHRDIKPDNIMVLRTSYALHRENSVKVLDFGIAKLTESQTADAEGPTKPLINTSQGVVLGTISYMSPEQSRGNSVDARTDIWSLGVVLYEMLMGILPFKGESAEDIRAAILKDKLSPLSADVPERLKWIVEKALRKDREDRYQTAREFFSDLRELQQQEFASAALRDHSVSTEAGVVTPVDNSTINQPTGTHEVVSPPTSSAEYLVREIKRHKLGVLAALSTLLIVAVGGGYLLYRAFSRGGVEQTQSSMKISRLTDSGDARAAAISPDGQYVVYARQNGGKQSLWLRQVATASEKEIVPAAPVSIKGPTFSTDGNLIYYSVSDFEAIFSNGVLYQVPTLGGTPKKILARVSSPITFSPDGKQFAFVRDNSRSGEGNALMIANVDGTGEKVLITHDGKATFFWESGPAWSPDGKKIVCGATIDPGADFNTIVEVSVDDGTEKRITPYVGWKGGVERVVWLRDGSGLIVIAAPDVTTGTQVWLITYPEGNVKRVTNDLNDYGTHSLTLTSDSRTLIAVEKDETKKIWVMPVGEDSSNARQITNGKFDGGGSLTWSPEGKIVYTTNAGDMRDLWMINQDGTDKRPLTSDTPWEAYPRFSPDGRYLVFNSDRSGISHIWRTDADGGNSKQLTGGNSEDYSPAFTPDGKWVLFESWRSGKEATWKVSIEGGEPVQLVKQTSAFPSVSPDGKHFVCAFHDDDPNSAWRFAIFPIEGGQPVKLLDLPLTAKGHPGIYWTPEGNAILYVNTLNGVSNIWRQPIDGGPAKQITNFRSDLIFRFALSRDGKQLALVRGTQTRDAILIRDFR